MFRQLSHQSAAAATGRGLERARIAPRSAARGAGARGFVLASGGWRDHAGNAARIMEPTAKYPEGLCARLQLAPPAGQPVEVFGNPGRPGTRHLAAVSRSVASLARSVMVATVEYEPSMDRWLLPLVDQLVIWCGVDYAVSFGTRNQVSIRIEQPFVYTSARGVENLIIPEGNPVQVAPVLAIARLSVHRGSRLYRWASRADV